MAHSMHTPDRWFSYDPGGDGYESHATEMLARSAAMAALDYYRDDASTDGWSDDVEGIVWGEIRGRVVCTERRKPDPEQGDSEYFDEIVAYALRDVVVTDGTRIRAISAYLDTAGLQGAVDATREWEGLADEDRERLERWGARVAQAGMDAAEEDCGAANDAFDAIAAACGCPHWEYPGQLVRDVQAVIAERDELRATLANERGEGEGPSEGWMWDGRVWRYGDGSVWRYGDGWIVQPSRAAGLWCWCYLGDGLESLPYPHARDAMRAADVARDLSGGSR